MISMRMLPPLLFGTSICNENTTISCYFMSTSLQIISRRHHHLVRRRGMDGGYSNDHNPCDHPRLLLLCHSQRQYSNDAFIRFLAVMSFSSFSCCCCCCCCPCIHRSKCGCRGQCNGYRTLLWKLLGRQTTDF